MRLGWDKLQATNDPHPHPLLIPVTRAHPELVRLARSADRSRNPPNPVVGADEGQGVGFQLLVATGTGQDHPLQTGRREQRRSGRAGWQRSAAQLGSRGASLVRCHRGECRVNIVKLLKSFKTDVLLSVKTCSANATSVDIFVLYVQPLFFLNMFNRLVSH